MVRYLDLLLVQGHLAMSEDNPFTKAIQEWVKRWRQLEKESKKK